MSVETTPTPAAVGPSFSIDQATGDATWADAIIEFAPERAGRTVEILQRAVDRPVDDSADWHLHARLKEPRRVL